MDSMPEVLGGRRVLEQIRAGALGTWYRTETGAAMLFSPTALAGDGAVDRLVARVVTVNELNLPGVVRAADLISEQGRIWLLCDAPVAPTLGDLVSTPSGTPAPDAGSAARIARESATALLALHRAGTVHGAVGLDTVLPGADGVVRLNETGLAAALAGIELAADRDIIGWAATLRTMAAVWASHDPAATALLYGCAAAAESAGLSAALRRLTDGQGTLPDDEQRRATTVAAGPTAASTSAAQTPPTAAADACTLLPRATPESTPVDQATRLGRRGNARPRPPAPSTATSPNTAPQAPASAVGEPDGRRYRFGPGVPAQPDPAQIRALAAATGRGRGRPSGRRPRRRRALTAALLTVLIAAGVGAWLIWHRGGPLRVTGLTVAPAASVTGQCDVTADVVATIHTDGRGGVITYQWHRGDGQDSAVLHQTVAPGTRDVAVHLHWTFTGKGTYRANATLEILAPTRAQATDSFDYACH